jgi:hypothetical protein
MRRRLEDFIPIVLFAIVVQLSALGSICSEMMSSAAVQPASPFPR